MCTVGYSTVRAHKTGRVHDSWGAQAPYGDPTTGDRANVVVPTAGDGTGHAGH
ncbi:hypothetical protein [Haloechinothrix sp. LS1_15]|uniref:hypothetical protein n=1 Tax=Haloechinothrix sp. LS1_15 TaxID=2652248 RepID=UPI00294ACD1F|nr:hypothetical protein [Haloechinothrix sp. LS1_15]